MHQHHQQSCCSSHGCGSESGHSCHGGSCQCQCHHHEECHHHDTCDSHEAQILCLVKWSKYKLLKEKIMKQLEAKMGKKLDEVAVVAVDAFLAEWEQKENAKKTCNTFQEKLCNIFKR